MISLAEPLRKIVYYNNPCPEDKASIHRYKDKYYLTHSSFYAISDHVYGPYEYVGNTGCNVGDWLSIKLQKNLEWRNYHNGKINWLCCPSHTLG